MKYVHYYDSKIEEGLTYGEMLLRGAPAVRGTLCKSFKPVTTRSNEVTCPSCLRLMAPFPSFLTLPMNPDTASGKGLDAMAEAVGLRRMDEAKPVFDFATKTTFDISGDTALVTNVEFSRENVTIVDRSLEGAIFAALLDANMKLTHNPDATNRVTIPYVSGLFNTATGEWDEVLGPKLLEIPADVKWDDDGTCLIDGILVYNRDFDKSGGV